MKKFTPAKIVSDYRDPSGDTLILDPGEDMLGVESIFDFEVGESVLIEMTAADNSWWEVPGKIVGIEPDLPVLLLVKIKWAGAALLSESAQ